MTINILEFISILFYIALIILVVVLIVFVIKAIGTLSKVDKVVDDISIKSSKLDGLFNIVDATTDVVAGFSDSIVNVISSGVERLFNRKKENKNE